MRSPSTRSGNVSVVRGEQEQKVTLKAIVTRNEAVAEKVYESDDPVKSAGGTTASTLCQPA